MPSRPSKYARVLVDHGRCSDDPMRARRLGSVGQERGACDPPSEEAAVPTRFALTNEQIAAIVGATVDDVSSNWLIDEGPRRARHDRCAREGGGDRHDRHRGGQHLPAHQRVRRPRLLHAHVREPRRPREHAEGRRRPLPRPRLHPADRARQLRRLRRHSSASRSRPSPRSRDPGGAAAAVLADYFQGPHRRRERGQARLGVRPPQGERRPERVGAVQGPRDQALAAALDKPSRRVPAARPASRIITLTSPCTAGPDVAAAQRALGVPDDGGTAQSPRAPSPPGSGRAGTPRPRSTRRSSRTTCAACSDASRCRPRTRPRRSSAPSRRPRPAGGRAGVAGWRPGRARSA